VIASVDLWKLLSTNMRTFAFVLALCLVAGSLAQRRRNQQSRGGRQDTGYAAPGLDAGYASPSDAQPAYGGDQDIYQGAASSPAGSDDNIAMLEKAIPGVPGEDYPIYAEVPESGFSCEGQIDGGYYADPEAECQVFHICTADGAGGLSQYSFLCPNGTVFNQNYFICDWWFNFDCSEAEGLYSLNAEIAAEREAISAAGSASDAVGSYAAPDDAPFGGYDAPLDVVADAQSAYGQAARNARNGKGPQAGSVRGNRGNARQSQRG
jgi:hypothetical protein